VLDSDCFVDNVGAKMVEPYRKVFGTGSSFVVCGDFDTGHIVLERAADNFWGSFMEREALS
jgi:hypothetical protein